MNKEAALAELVALRRRSVAPSSQHLVLHEFQDRAWDFDLVTPWTKSACNLDAKLMIIGQDWASVKSLNDPRHNTDRFVELRKQHGRDLHLPTNRNLDCWLQRFFGLSWEQTYATNVSVFISPGASAPKSRWLCSSNARRPTRSHS
jgi:uracil-DNA glycosylase